MKLSQVIGITLMHALMGLVLVGCAKTPKGGPTGKTGSTDSLASLNEPPDPSGAYGAGSSSGLGLGAGSGEFGYGQADAMRMAPAGMIPELKTVFFAFDSYELSSDGVATLDSNIAWLLTNPNVQIQIEGHCDDKGTLEYNLNLGQNRADVVREYLIMAGVQGDRLHTISYGEERPLGTDDTQNRRAQFLVYDPNG